MLQLSPMNQAEFEPYCEDSIASYADENVKAGVWDAVSAHSNARKSFQDLLPSGLQTPDNFLYNIVEGTAGEHVGNLWIKILRNSNASTAYIFDLQISPAFRNRGYGRQALLALEQLAMDQGIVSIGLHVFAHNEIAQRLYRAAGYEVSGYRMQKRLLARNQLAASPIA
jgi:ribosomal protein S18 acetylase RimI-like enzyme